VTPIAKEVKPILIASVPSHIKASSIAIKATVKPNVATSRQKRTSLSIPKPPRAHTNNQISFYNLSYILPLHKVGARGVQSGESTCMSD